MNFNNFMSTILTAIKPAKTEKRGHIHLFLGQAGVLMAQLRSFNNYVDPILPNFDHLSPQEDNLYYPLLIWPFVDFLLNTYILFLFHVVIE